jgi:hypothetical protein
MRRYALLLAADQYRDPTISRLRYAERDGRVVEGFLREVAGFDRVEEFYGEALTKDAVLETAGRLARELAAAGGGLLLLFYAGHGVTHLNRHCLICPQARLRDLDEFDHAITVDRLRRVTALPGVERQLVVDACRTNLRAGERQVVEGFQAASLRNLAGADADAGEPGGWSVLASCDDGEQASEVEAIRHGAFSWAWLEELRVARGEGREVRLDDTLVARLRDRVADLGRTHGLGRQRPWVKSNALPPVILPGASTAVPATPTAASGSIPTTIPAPAPAGGGVLLRLQEQARRRAAEVAQRRTAFNQLYPVYLELRDTPGTPLADLLEAWADLCRSCGLAVIPATPGGLEWHGDGVRLIPAKVIPLPRPATATATRERPFENSLRMKFVPVPVSHDGRQKVLFCVWPTRVCDYSEFSRARSGVNGEWQHLEFEQGPEHPVVNVSWEDAKKFCEWLTEKERKEGRIEKEQGYRLPSDEEWSWAVGIGEVELRAEPRSPQDKDSKVEAGKHAWAYPWGRNWPPPKGAGNYGVSLKVDDYAYTSPVGSFAANPQGLHDLGGNVWEWCEDFYDGKSGLRVLRGASWYSPDPRSLLSSCRNGSTPGDRNSNCGFRVVLMSRSAC